MSSRNWEFRIQDMLDSINKIEKHVEGFSREDEGLSTHASVGQDRLEAPKKKTELWTLIDPTETGSEEPRAGNLHAGICEGVVFSSTRGRDNSTRYYSNHNPRKYQP